MRRYRFILEKKAAYPPAALCRALHVSRSGYYAWAGRAVSARTQADAELTARISAAHTRSRRTSGAPRVHAELRAAGVRCARKRVARLMRAAGLVGRHRRRRTRTTVAEPPHTPGPNLVARDFRATAPGRRWCGDSTSVATHEGWLYLAVLLDAHSRRVVGWAMADHLRTELALDALALALQRRQPMRGLVHHTDRGSQYTAAAYQATLVTHGVICSMGRSGECLDNAMAAGSFATLKAEMANTRIWPSHAAARLAIFAWIAVWYNRQRRHSTLGYLTPVALEAQHWLLLQGHAA
jgi:putative transposase